MEKKIAIAMCDPSGIRKAFVRMDDAPLLAVNTALDKAYTAAAFGISTDAWHTFINNDLPLAARIVNVTRLTVFLR
jgi:uncharacterized protein GlcG (DUF336 family)